LKTKAIAAVLIVGSLAALVGYSFLKNGTFSPKIVPIATYRNSRDIREHEQKRVAAILSGHEIDFVFARSRGMTVFTRESRSTEARTLLAHAVKDEGLRITLLELKKGEIKPVAVTPYAILEQEKSR